MNKKPKPTIAELEAILRRSDMAIEMSPSGEVTVGAPGAAARGDEVRGVHRLTEAGECRGRIVGAELGEVDRLRDQLAAAIKRAEEAEDLLRAVAAYCRGLGPRTDEAASVLGHVERDPEAAAIKARVARLEEALRSIVDFGCCAYWSGGGSQGHQPHCAVTKARAALAEGKGTTPCSGCGGSGNAVCGACNDSGINRGGGDCTECSPYPPQCAACGGKGR